MPRPNPTFWPVESPALLAGGESGVDVDEGVVDGSASDDVGEEEETALEWSELSVGRVDVGFRLETNVVGDEAGDSVGADTVALSLSLAPVLEYCDCDCDQLVSPGSLVSVAVADGHSHPVLAGGCVGQAVFGPNCLTK
jgi:hypothetical protein